MKSMKAVLLCLVMTATLCLFTGCGDDDNGGATQDEIGTTDNGTTGTNSSTNTNTTGNNVNTTDIKPGAR
ncbi:MAG TPA: hypothetical protein VJZ01_08205 [Lachnospiraceae bacterium]|nr:hypothetical protein [Lachnospiraceae bacterium]